MPRHVIFHSSMKSKPSDLPDHLGYWLRKLSNAVSRSFAERLARHEISVPQWVILRILFDHDTLPIKEIVTRVEVDQGSLSRTVDRLVVRGLIERKINSIDRRAAAISLSKMGRTLVPKLSAEADQNDQAFFKSLTQQNRKAFLLTIQNLLKQNKSDERSPTQ